MSEPIILHDGAGNTLTVYTHNQAEALLRGGQWYATQAEAEAARPSAVTTGSVVSEGTAQLDAPAPPPAAKTKRPAKGKGGL